MVAKIPNSADAVPVDAYSFDDSLGRICKQINDCIGHILRFKLDQAHVDLSTDEWTVLAYLFEYEGLKQNQIAAAVGRDKTAINRLIDGLEHKSLVRRQQDPEDKRINQVVLTPQAEQMKARLHRLAADTLAIAWGGVAEADKQATLRVLKQILANVSCSSVFDHVSNLDGLDRPEHPAH